MKNKNVAFIAVAWLAFTFACNNNHPSHCGNGIVDGNETGIDCGGDCPPCPTSPNSVNPDFFGSWYSLFRVVEATNTLQMYINNTNAACRVDITNTPLHVSSIVYKSYGTLGSCVYPSESYASYTPYQLIKLTSDSIYYGTPSGFTVMKKGGNPYLGQSPYVKLRFVVINNEAGDSSLYCSHNGITNYWMQGDPYMEVIGTNSTSSGLLHVTFNKRIHTFYDPIPSWLNPNQVYHITYKIQFIDASNNVMYETPVDKKIMYGNTSATNPFITSQVVVYWGNY